MIERRRLSERELTRLYARLCGTWSTGRIMESGTCWRCGDEARRQHFVLDALVPSHLGGSLLPENLRLACPPCAHQRDHSGIPNVVEFFSAWSRGQESRFARALGFSHQPAMTQRSSLTGVTTYTVEPVPEGAVPVVPEMYQGPMWTTLMTLGGNAPAFDDDPWTGEPGDLADLWKSVTPDDPVTMLP
jgi:hypothetical protein